MGSIVLAFFYLWATAAIGGMMELVNRRIIAACCMFITLAAFSAVTWKYYQPHSPYVAFESGTVYHTRLCNYGPKVDGLWTAAEAQRHGLEPCPYCMGVVTDSPEDNRTLARR